MPWVKLDDRFPSHRKVALLSDRAFRLYVSALCWSSENLTEGKILDRELTLVARIRNTKGAATELEAVNLWERVDDGWMIHDFLEYNPDKQQVKAERAGNAARQQAYRDRKKAEREAEKDAKKIQRNGVTHPSRNASRNGGSNGTPAPARTPFSPNGENGAAASERPTGLPDQLTDLKQAIAAAGLAGISWRLTESQWEYTRQATQRAGIPAMVACAVNNARLKGVPAGATAWIEDWRSLEAPPENGVAYLPAVAGPPTENQRKRALFDEAASRFAGGQQ